MEFIVLRDMSQLKSKVRTLSFRKAKFPALQGLSQKQSLGKLTSGTRVKNKAGRYLRMPSIVHKIFLRPGINDQARMTRV